MNQTAEIDTQTAEADRKPVRRGTGVALWRQIAEKLRSDITSGKLVAGERLATEHAMAQELGVNRHTVRRAVGVLADDGLVRVEQGRGTFVAEPVVPFQIQRRTSFRANMLATNRVAEGRLLSDDVIEADREIAEALQIGEGSRVVVLETLSFADGRPLAMARKHFPCSRLSGIADAFRQTGSVTESLKVLGIHEYERKVSRIMSRMPSGREARTLQQPTGRPVLVSENINTDPTGRPIEYSITSFAGDRVQIVVEP